MATDLPGWVSRGESMVGRKLIKRPGSNTKPIQAAAVQSSALRAQTAAQSHNVFRPDIFRVSDGYLN